MKFGKNDEAVSPVIGVILMVAITVILAAVIAAFVFGMGPPVKAPQTQLKFSADTASGLKISHDGGDSLITTQEKITVKFANNDTIVGMHLTTPLTPITSYSGATLKDFISNGADTRGNETFTAGTAFTNTSIKTLYKTNDVLTVQVLDVPSGQLIASTKVTVQ